MLGNELQSEADVPIAQNFHGQVVKLVLGYLAAAAIVSGAGHVGGEKLDHLYIKRFSPAARLTA